MSMIGNLARVSQAQLDALARDPESITAFLYPDQSETPPPKQAGFLAKLFGKKTKSDIRPVSKTAESLSPDDQVDLDKAWHTLHFLFTGSAWEGDFPRGFLNSCGTPVGDVDVGYGPARAFSPNEVQEIATYLDSLDPLVLRASLDPKKLLEEEIYPNFGPASVISDEDWDYIGGALNTARDFIRETKNRNMGLLVYVN